MKHFTDTPIWDSNCDKLFWDMYLKGVENSQTKYVSISEIENLRFFPPTYIEAAEYDCLHDKEIEFVEKLKSQAVYENSQDDDTRRFVPDEVYNSVEEVREAIAFLMSRYDSTDGPFVYPIITNDGNQNIGYIQLCKVELEEEETWEIGYHIAKNFTGKGYATEAVKAFLAAMAKKLNLKEIYGICLAENTASVRVHKNADSPKSIRVLEIIRGEKFKLSKQSGKITTKITTFDTLFL